VSLDLWRKEIPRQGKKAHGDKSENNQPERGLEEPLPQVEEHSHTVYQFGLPSHLPRVREKHSGTQVAPELAELEYWLSAAEV
jgi:hypothetical protein